MKKYTKFAAVGAALAIVSIVAGCGTTNGATSPSPVSNEIGTTNTATTQNQSNSTASTPATNSLVTNTTASDTSANVSAGTGTTGNNTQPTSSAELKTFAVGNRFSIGIPANAQRTGPYPTDSDAYFWTYKQSKISVSTDYNPTYQTLKSTLTGYSKGLTISSTSQGKDWFEIVGTQQHNGVTQTVITKGYVGVMIQTVSVAYPQSQASPYETLAQTIISSFQAKTV